MSNRLEDRLQELVVQLAADHNGLSDSFEAMFKIVTVGSYDSSFTIGLGDAGTTIETTSASPMTITIPTISSVAFPINTIMEICQSGAGQVTVAPVSGAVTLRSRGAAYKLAGQWACAYLRQRDTNEWVLTGDVTT